MKWNFVLRKVLSFMEGNFKIGIKSVVKPLYQTLQSIESTHHHNERQSAYQYTKNGNSRNHMYRLARVSGQKVPLSYVSRHPPLIGLSRPPFNILLSASS